MNKETKTLFDKTITIDRRRDKNLSVFSKATLDDRYLLEEESYQDLFARVACAYADDEAHAQRLYDYISNLWFMPATPVLSNGGAGRALPISCYLNSCRDSLGGIVELWNENVWLASNGGGVGSYWGNLRSIGEDVKKAGKTSGIIPFIKVMDSQTLAISQGSLRRGSAAVYLDIWHPEIEEFVEIRKPTGGDANRRSLNLHHGVMVDDAFMEAVEKGTSYNLRSPKTNEVIKTIDARALWSKILIMRIETGEPYIVFSDTVNNAMPEHHKKSGLRVQSSNLCAEIMLPTGVDHHGKDRTAVCCLSSLNIEFYEEWSIHEGFMDDVLRFLDNVLQDFIDRAPDTMAKARYAAAMERSIGLGVMGFHSFLQAKGIPFEGVMAKVWNNRIFSFIKENCDRVNEELAHEKGPCPDAAEYDIMKRFSNCTAIAPTASISIIANQSSPGIEPFKANTFTHKTLTGSHFIKNRHLEETLKKYRKNTDEVWSSIVAHDGSVQHLDFLTDTERDVFKTAIELDQRWVVEHAADRTPFIDQSQSVNLFFEPAVHKKELHGVHFKAWKSGVKSLYYCRSEAKHRASKIGTDVERVRLDEDVPSLNILPIAAPEEPETQYDECLACQ